jgi:hypothetical protein
MTTLVKTSLCKRTSNSSPLCTIRVCDPKLEVSVVVRDTIPTNSASQYSTFKMKRPDKTDPKKKQTQCSHKLRNIPDANRFQPNPEHLTSAVPFGIRCSNQMGWSNHRQARKAPNRWFRQHHFRLARIRVSRPYFPQCCGGFPVPC